VFIGFDGTVNTALFLIYLFCSKSWYARIYWDLLSSRFSPAVGRDLGDCADSPAAYRYLGPGRQKAVHPLGRGGHPVGSRAPLAGHASSRNSPSSLGGAGKPVHQPGDLRADRRGDADLEEPGPGLAQPCDGAGQRMDGLGRSGILVDGLHSYFGAERYFRELEHVRMFAYLAVLGYWMVQFWLEEPARQPISPELRAYIQALHLRIKK